MSDCNIFEIPSSESSSELILEAISFPKEPSESSKFAVVVVVVVSVEVMIVEVIVVVMAAVGEPDIVPARFFVVGLCDEIGSGVYTPLIVA